MIVYLLKSMLCLLALLLIHRLLLQREVLHRFNRFFLLAAVLGSFLIPLYSIEVPMKEVPEMMEESEEILQNPVEVYEDFDLAVGEQELQSRESNLPENTVTPEISQNPFPWKNVLWAAYLLISAGFLFRFLRNLVQLNLKIRKNPHVEYRNETLVLLPVVSSPFSFLKYIFVSRPSFEREGISDAVFAHEQCHVSEKHSWDILLIEALMVPLWFHPGLYFARQAIRLNHEFIADQVALKATSVKDYQQQLLHYLKARPSQAMASSLNFSLTKKRLAMMKRDSKNPFRWMKILVLVPLIAGIVYLFSDKVSVQPEEEIAAKTSTPAIETPNEEVETNIKILSDREVEVDGESVPIEELSKWLDEIKAAQPIVRFSASPGIEMGIVADVQEILREKELRRVVYVEDLQSKKTETWQAEQEVYYRNAYILVEDVNMVYTPKSYPQLTEKEKKGLQSPMKPKAKEYPDPAVFESWKDNKTYAIWIDGVVKPNEKLNDYTATDFAGFFQSSVTSNARSQRFPQPYQVNLYTEAYFDQELGPNAAMYQPRTNQDTITLTSRMVTWNKDIQKYPDPTTAYLQNNARYENLRTSGAIYLHKSQQEKAELERWYRELNDEYSKTPDNRKKRLKEPIQPSSETRRNGDPAQSASEKIAVRTASNTEGSETSYRIVYGGSLQSKALKEYLEHYGAFQTRANESSFGKHKSNAELEALLAAYREFNDLYAALSIPERLSVKRPTFPYARIEKDGIVTFKHFDQMTAEERKAQGC